MNWLEKQMELAAEEVATWPQWKQDAMREAVSPGSETLLTPQAETAENSHSQNPSNNSVSGTAGDLDRKGN